MFQWCICRESAFSCLSAPMRRSVQRTHCSCGGGVHVDYTPHIGPHWINGSMWSESMLVDAQISRALVHHLADDVYFHLQKTRWGYCYLLTCLNISAARKQTYRQSFQTVWKHIDNKNKARAFLNQAESPEPNIYLYAWQNALVLTIGLINTAVGYKPFA